MGRRYTKSEITANLEWYFKRDDCKNLYKDACINYKGVTKGTKENYSTVIVDYIVEHIEEFKKGFENITVTRNKKKSYKFLHIRDAPKRYTTIESKLCIICIDIEENILLVL